MKLGAVLTWQNYEADWERYDTGDFTSPPFIPDTQIYRENLHLADLVEPLGFDSMFSVEHHMTPHHMTGSALQLLTYFAGRTERIDFGTSLVVLPWHHPVRVAEEICFLDNLLDGRKLWLGLGRGSSPREFEGLGFDQGESRDRFAEGIDIMRLAFTEQRFSYKGKHFDLPEVTVRPRPASPDIADRMYIGATSSSTLPIAAPMDLNLMFVAGGPWDQAAAHLRTYNGYRSQHGLGPSWPIVVAYMYCAPTAEKAWEGAGKWISQGLRTATKHYLFDKPERFEGIKGYEERVATGKMTKDIPRSVMEEGFAKNALWGTPDQIIEKIQWLADHTHATQVVALVNPGDISVDEAEASMRLYAEEVIPAARSIEPALYAPDELEPVEPGALSPIVATP
jgi:alkanesulfonate monooxygenase SsuD/methylene tetrahydromethanopterin reductase-like flavin-dependent oxidoreductase (luciferase family)